MKSTHNVKRFKHQAGVTLMELIAGLAVMAVVFMGALALYQTAQSSQRSTQLMQDLAAVRAGVKQMWQGQGSYGSSGSSLNNVLVTSKRLPTTIRVNSGTTPPTLTHAANGLLSVTSAVTAFDVSLTDISEDLCMALLTGAQGWQSVSVGGGTPVTVFPVSPDVATTLCASGTTVVFRGN